MSTYICVYIYIERERDIHIHIYIYIHTYIICIYTYIYIYIHIHTYIHRSPSVRSRPSKSARETGRVLSSEGFKKEKKTATHIWCLLTTHM